jgi:hypothetical protein
MKNYLKLHIKLRKPFRTIIIITEDFKKSNIKIKKNLKKNKKIFKTLLTNVKFVFTIKVSKTISAKLIKYS